MHVVAVLMHLWREPPGFRTLSPTSFLPFSGPNLFSFCVMGELSSVCPYRIAARNFQRTFALQKIAEMTIFADAPALIFVKAGLAKRVCGLTLSGAFDAVACKFLL